MEDLLARVGDQIEKLMRVKDDAQRDNAVLRRENERLRAELAETSVRREDLEKRVRFSSRHVESALRRIRLLSEDF